MRLAGLGDIHQSIEVSQCAAPSGFGDPPTCGVDSWVNVSSLVLHMYTMAGESQDLHQDDGQQRPEIVDL